MTKKEKQDHTKKNAVPDPILKSDPKSLKGNPAGETICHADFSNGCVNEDTDSLTASQGENENEKH